MRCTVVIKSYISFGWALFSWSVVKSSLKSSCKGSLVYRKSVQFIADAQLFKVIEHTLKADYLTQRCSLSKHSRSVLNCCHKPRLSIQVSLIKRSL